MSYGLYIHIPFCGQRCAYCDFYSTQASGGVPEGYIDALLRDFAWYAPRESGGSPQRPATVYFGGGTPSLLLPRQVARVLEAVNPLPGAEITLEANPESATLEKLRGYRQAGVNRLSFGVQSANEESLRRLGRLHTARQARQALGAARQAGFVNISGDIMLALPGYTNREFDETLALLQAEGATHISAYLLKIEEGTAFGQHPPQGLPGADEASEFYLYAVEQLAAQGYAQYEISNFARPGFESAHNLIYWDCGEYLGLGPAAHSCMAGRRFSFAPDVARYVQGGSAPRQEGECTVEDYILLRLRLAAGLSEAEMDKRYGVTLSQRQRALLERLAAHGLARPTGEGWALTPQGLLVQNSILAQLLD